MEKIAWILDDGCIYWNDVVLVLAVLAAVFCFLALCIRKGTAAAGILTVPLAVVSSLMLSRLAHWYFRPEQYVSLSAALSDLGQGGFALMGVFAGCFLAAVFVRLVTVSKALPQLLDCMSLAGALGIGLGRLSACFDGSGRGMAVPAGSIWAGLVTDPVSGGAQWRLNTFLLQAAAAGFLFAVLLVWYLAGEKRQERKNGDAALIFLLCYGASQVVLDSTRYDALMLRSNGFISAVQVLCAAAMALTVLVFAARLVRAGGWKKWYMLLWSGQGACFALAGFMEYYVQRHGYRAVFAYSVMGSALAALVVLTLTTRILAAKEEQAHRAWLEQLAIPKKEEA